jgi:RNA polymerase-binding transcription factor DksA
VDGCQESIFKKEVTWRKKIGSKKNRQRNLINGSQRNQSRETENQISQPEKSTRNHRTLPRSARGTGANHWGRQADGRVFQGDGTGWIQIWGEAATIYNKQILLTLNENERMRLRELDEALDRIGGGTYGVCEECGEPIGLKRLEVRPVAKYCVPCLTKLEKGKL